MQSVAVVPGRFNGGSACCLAIIFLPLAFLAGSQPDGYVVVYATTIPPDRGYLPPQVS